MTPDVVTQRDSQLHSTKTITVFLDASPFGEKRAAYAAALSRRFGAHLVGVDVVFAGIIRHPSVSFVRGHDAMQEVITADRRHDAQAEAAAVRVGADFRALCARLNVPGEFRTIVRRKTAEEAFRNSLHSDLVVVGHPRPNGLPDDLSAEQMLLASGVPVLIVPNAWDGETIGDRILIGWNATREARRAVSDAMPLLVAAQSVTVLCVDPVGIHGCGDDPGADIAEHLTRHGAHVDVRHVVSHGASIAQVLLRSAARDGSDLLVVGAYSHPRWREFLLGGTTRTLLEQMPVPVLISR